MKRYYWEVVSREFLDTGNVDSIDITEHDYRQDDGSIKTRVSMRFMMNDGRTKYVPLFYESELEVGDRVSPNSVEVITLERDGEKIYRVDGKIEGEEEVEEELYDEEDMEEDDEEIELGTWMYDTKDIYYTDNKNEKQEEKGEKKKDNANLGCAIVVFFLFLSGIPAAAKGEGPIGTMVVAALGIAISYYFAKMIYDS